MKSFKADQRGIAHLGLILLVLFVVIGISGAGYYVFNKNQESVSGVEEGVDVDNDENKETEADVESGSEESKPENQQ